MHSKFLSDSNTFYRRYCPVLILLLGALLRLLYLSRVPGGLHQDEAFVLLNSYDLLHEGRDSAGYAFPHLYVQLGRRAECHVLLASHSSPTVEQRDSHYFSQKASSGTGRYSNALVRLLSGKGNVRPHCGSLDLIRLKRLSLAHHGLSLGIGCQYGPRLSHVRSVLFRTGHE